MKRLGHIWDIAISMNNIYESFKLAAKHKKIKTLKLVNNHFEENMKNIQTMLLNHSYVTSPYRIKTIYEPKKRDIYILPFYPDRIIHHIALDPLIPYFTKRFYTHSYSCIKDRGQHKGSLYAAECIRKYKYYLQCDISKFYPSINHDILYNILEHYIKDPNMLWLFHTIIYSIEGETNCPIGNYSSQWLGNLYLTQMDFKIKHELKIEEYMRYCDDFVLFSNDKEKLRYSREWLKNYLTEERKLTFSKCELRPSGQGLDILGYRHFPSGKILVRKSTAAKIKFKIKDTMYKLSHDLISAEDALHIFASYNGILSHAKTYNFRQSIDFDAQFELVKELFHMEQKTQLINNQSEEFSMENDKRLIVIADRNGKPVLPEGYKEKSPYQNQDDINELKNENKQLLNTINDMKQSIVYLTNQIQKTENNLQPTITKNQLITNNNLPSFSSVTTNNSQLKNNIITESNNDNFQAVICNDNVNLMRSFKQVSKDLDYGDSFEGRKIKIESVLNQPIGIYNYKICTSKFQRDNNFTEYVMVQISYKNEYRVLITGSRFIMRALKTVDKEGFPFKGMIIKNGNKYLIVDPN